PFDDAPLPAMRPATKLPWPNPSDWALPSPLRSTPAFSRVPKSASGAMPVSTTATPTPCPVLALTELAPVTCRKTLAGGGGGAGDGVGFGPGLPAAMDVRTVRSGVTCSVADSSEASSAVRVATTPDTSGRATPRVPPASVTAVCAAAMLSAWTMYGDV